MTKLELLTALQSKKMLDNNQRTPEWINAFDEFNRDPANKGNKVSMSCGSCFSQVRNWLKRG